MAMDKNDFIKALDILSNWCLDQTEVYHEYDKDVLSNMAIIHQHVVGQLAWDFYTRNGIPFEEMCERNEALGAGYRQLVMGGTGLDLAETWGGPLDAETIAEDGENG